MIKKHKLHAIISSTILLLPIVFGVIFFRLIPETVAIHFGFDGSADGFAGRWVVILLLPLILLALHFLCLFITSLDFKRHPQNPKTEILTFYILPFVSVFSTTVTFTSAIDGFNINAVHLMTVVFGVLFVMIGNYLPKAALNRTFGVRLPWTLGNEENWRLTHRFAGRLWVICGLILLFAVFIPPMAVVSFLLIIVFASCIAITVYSYRIYKRHQREGIKYEVPIKSKAEGITLKITAVVVPIILVGIAIIMFVGEVEVSFDEASMTADATFWGELELQYNDIDEIIYRESFTKGERTWGFVSARLSLGSFRNSELGNYTLYGYTWSPAAVIIKSGERIIVLSDEDAQGTKAIYDNLASRLGR